jgi:S1-C subfamily serine protease
MLYRVGGWGCVMQGRGSGVNFALPSDLVLEIVPNLIVYGNPTGKGMG